MDAMKPISFTQIKPLEMSIAPQVEDKKETEGLSSLFKKAFMSANEALLESGRMARRLAKGDDIELHQITIADQKSKIALHLTTQIVSKITSACTTLFQMQI